MSSDSEIAVAFSAMKEASQERRAGNRENSQQLLIARGIQFEVKNDGIHLVVTGRDYVFDFWPGTGKFIARKGGPTGRGVFNLIKHCGVSQ